MDPEPVAEPAPAPASERPVRAAAQKAADKKAAEAEAAAKKSQHHTNRPPLTTTDGPGEQERCPSAPHNFDATWSWPGACWHSRRSSLPPCPGCAQSTPEAAHLGRYTAVTLGAVSAGSSRQHVRRVVCAW